MSQEAFSSQVEPSPFIMHPQRYDILIIGGGPSGSSAAIELAGDGANVAVVEKRPFPREVLCGEFLSGEVAEAIRQFGLYDEFLSLRPNRVTSFAFVPESGVRAVSSLGFEAWSLKRSLFDQMLLAKAEASGAAIIQPAEVTAINRSQEGYVVRCTTPEGERLFSAGTVIAAYGKQSPLDRVLKRSFASNRSGLNGIKYHVDRSAFAEFPDGDIQIFAAEGIYCGINRVNVNEATVCFLMKSRVSALHPKDALGVLLQRNGTFRSLFHGDLRSELRERSAHGAGNIFFGRKAVVENGIYMIGDAAALIAPLAGDGIGMAIESGRLLAGVLTAARRDSLGKQETESLYIRAWWRLFRTRLVVASALQSVAMRSLGGNVGGRLMKKFPQLAKSAIEWTRNAE